MPLIDVTGKRFGRLVAVERAPNKGRNTMWAFDCDCGNRITAYVAAVKRGLTKSCGCLQRETRPTIRRTHGRSCTREWYSWVAARDRCARPDNPAWADYGGRGIEMCERWRTDFVNFLADMGPRPPGTSLDRIDNDRGYEPGNCRWAPKHVQARNTRANVYVLVDGCRTSLSEFAEREGVDYKALHNRMARFGIDHEAAADMLRKQPPRRRTATKN